MSHLVHYYGVIQYPNFTVETMFYPVDSIWTFYPQDVKWNICTTDGYWRCLDVSAVSAAYRIATDLGSNYTLNDWTDVSGPGVEFVLQAKQNNIEQINIKNFSTPPSNGEIISISSNTNYTLPANTYALVIDKQSTLEITINGQPEHACYLSLIDARPSDTLLTGDGKILIFNLS